MTRSFIQADHQTLAVAGARVVVLRGPDRGRALRLEREEISIGAASSCDLVLTDETVSRHHLSLRILASSYLATDLESTNGTYLAGHRVQVVHLQPGDVIEIGKTRLRLEAARERVEFPLSDARSFGRLIGRSTEARRLFALLEAVARQDATVLLIGEPGTGKELAAHSIHEASRRAERPLVAVDCSNTSSAMMEATLFGHEAGATPGAAWKERGALVEANGGTLFLDRVSQLPDEAQRKLLRALERGEVRPVGAARPVPVDVRVIAGSDRDLRPEVNRGAFREDLFYRLNIASIRIPPLRERIDDLPILANHFYRELTGDAEAVLPPSTFKRLVPRAWPGNVRELRHTIERTFMLSELGAEEPAGGENEQETYAAAKAGALAAFERGFLTSLMLRANGNVTRAARMGNMDRVNLLRLLRRNGISRGA
jgi:DNA-binding NtrC family response regulator